MRIFKDYYNKIVQKLVIFVFLIFFIDKMDFQLELEGVMGIGFVHGLTSKKLVLTEEKERGGRFYYPFQCHTLDLVV